MAYPFFLTLQAFILRTMLPDSAGGALMFTREQFRAINGYSISYWGWGLEVCCVFCVAYAAEGRVLACAYVLKHTYQEEEDNTIGAEW